MSDQYMAEIRKNIADAEQREKERIALIVERANASVNAAAEAREAAERPAEQERERANTERERARIEAEQERCRRAARSGWAGDDASFAAAWPQIWIDYQREQAQRAIDAQRAAIDVRLRHVF